MRRKTNRNSIFSCKKCKAEYDAHRRRESQIHTDKREIVERVTELEREVVELRERVAELSLTGERVVVKLRERIAKLSFNGESLLNLVNRIAHLRQKFLDYLQ